MFRSKKTMQHTQEPPTSQSVPPILNQPHSESLLPNYSDVQPNFTQLLSQPLPTSSPLHQSSSFITPNERGRTTFLPVIRPSFHSVVNRESSLSPSSDTLNRSFSSQPTSFEPSFHNRSSSSSQMEPDNAIIDEDDAKLLSEVEIIGEHGNILRTQKISAKEVFKLTNGERVFVRVNEFGQPIKAVAGLVTRFLTLLLKEPNLCPPDKKDWPELKTACGAKLMAEVRAKFILPQTKDVDRVIFYLFGQRFRTIRYRLKCQLLGLAKKKLNEVYRIDENMEQRHYSEEELLQALDLVEPPPNFVDHQWELYKSHLRSVKAKKLSENGEKARGDQIHIHTTGSVSYARKRDEFKLKNKREPNDVEFFHITHESKNGSYADERSQQFMEEARKSISEKTIQIGGSESIDQIKQFEIERNVMLELMGPDMPGRARGYGTGVTKSQVTPVSRELRQIGTEGITSSHEVRKLLARLNSQDEEIRSQDERMKKMQKTMNDLQSQNQMLLTTLQNIFGSVGPTFQNVFASTGPQTQVPNDALSDEEDSRQQN